MFYEIRYKQFKLYGKNERFTAYKHFNNALKKLGSVKRAYIGYDRNKNAIVTLVSLDGMLRFKTDTIGVLFEIIGDVETHYIG